MAEHPVGNKMSGRLQRGRAQKIIVQRTVSNIIDVNRKRKKLLALLCEAIKMGLIRRANSIVGRLSQLKQKLKPNHLYDALICAAKTGSAQIVDTLLEHGAVANGITNIDENVKSPIYCAAKFGHGTVVARLLKAGALVEFGDDSDDSSVLSDFSGVYSDYSPLTIAVRRGHVEIVKMILRDRPTTNLASAFAKAVKDGREDMVVLLMQGNKTWSKRISPVLGKAVKHNHDSILRRILRDSAEALDVSCALGKAIKLGRDDLVELLLHGKTIIKDASLPLYQAIKCQRGDLVELLLDGRAEGLGDLTRAFLIALKQNNHVLAERLLSVATTIEKHIALDAAIKRPCLEMAERLLRLGWRSRTMILTAAKTGIVEILNTVLRYAHTEPKKDVEAALCMSLNMAIHELKDDMVKALLRAGACEFVSNGHARCYAPLIDLLEEPFMSYNMKVKMRIFDLFIQYARRCVNIPDHEGLHPLHYTSILKDGILTEKLLLAGADPNCFDIHKRTPLHIAHESSLGPLLRAGACVDSMDVNGITPFDEAFCIGDIQKAETLLMAGAKILDYGRADIIYSLIPPKRIAQLRTLTPESLQLRPRTFRSRLATFMVCLLTEDDPIDCWVADDIIQAFNSSFLCH